MATKQPPFLSTSGSVLPRKTGNLILITGPMFSGKSSEVMRYITRFTHQDVHFIVIRHSLEQIRISTHGEISQVKTLAHNDNASTTLIYAHSKLKVEFNEPHCFVPELTMDLIEPGLNKRPFDAVIIDEAQFFGASLVPFVEEALKRELTIIVSGLLLTKDNTPWMNMLLLVGHAMTHHQLKAICKLCKKECALYSCYKPDLKIGNTEKKDALGKQPFVCVGGEEEYEALCRSCMMEKYGVQCLIHN